MAGRQDPGPALRREPAPAGGLLPRPEPPRGGIATARQLQGKELSYNNIADADAAWECVRGFAECGVRHRQARQPVRCRDRRHAARGLPQRVRDRSDLGLRRHHRLQPRGRRRDGGGGQRAVRRGPDRARIHARRARRDRAQGQRARARRRPGAARGTRRTSSASAAACWCRPPTRQRERRIAEDGHPARADRGSRSPTCSSPGASPSS